MLLAIKKRGDSPIFSRLSGYKEFLEGEQDLKGLVANGNELTFTFDRPIRAGLVEVLSFAPFGYICSENLNADGTWKSKDKFISSGPYRIASVSIGKEYLLELRKDWASLADPLAPKYVKVVHAIPTEPLERERLIVDSPRTEAGLDSFTTSFRLVPEYLNSVLLGNLDNGYFSDIQRRKSFRALVEKERLGLPESFQNHIRASAFYSGLRSKARPDAENEVQVLPVPQEPLLIEGKEPNESSFKHFTWLTLKKALEDAHLPYKFADNVASWEQARSKAYDIRIRATSVGGSPDAWGIDVLFCSLIGPGLPDPSNHICGLIEHYENDEVDDQTLANKFLDSVDRDAAIIPISHHGGQLYLGSSIIQDSLNPTLNVMRFDQLQVK